ncbi:unnamed protein product [Plutella xylostella]|uniref:(diamondback moth) hypothetical protein n=1 Tax=Plutella xylostella TaxID=51655 RepID=A0A8S4G4U9_PLUXY|nr:unnamed protein product [Plutella xylostella]
MEQWLSESLSRILAFDVPEDLINYILDIKNEGDLNEYMKTLLDFDNPQHKNFYLELSRRKFSNKGSSLPKQQKKKISKSKGQSEVVMSVEEPPGISPEKETAGAGKKKTKYVNLYSQEGKNAQVVLLKGN